MEDASYRSSSQYRLWTFTPESLAAVRNATNAAAAAQVKEAIQRARDKKRKKQAGGGEGSDTSSGGANTGDDTPSSNVNGAKAKEDEEDKEIECLTPEEEAKLVRYYCRKIMEIAAQVFEFPTNVKATAPTFLRRFFTRTSPMTYHPKTLLSTILYLTTKTENHYISLSNFSAKIPKSTPEEILAPEFVVAMGLRWCFDIKHPFRGLEGCIMELMKVFEGKYVAPPVPPPPPSTSADSNNASNITKSPSSLPSSLELQTRLHGLPPNPLNPTVPPPSPKHRIERAHGKARLFLSTSALLTDAYFLFTPPQIMLAALYLVDPPLCTFYIDLKHPYSFQTQLKSKLLETIEKCAEELKKGGEPGAPISKEELDEVMRIDRKLFFCRNPEKLDLMKVNKLAKRGVTEEEDNGGGGGAEEERREREVKKRRLEREKSFKEGEALFGGGAMLVGKAK
ncbi:cyclin-like protein [Kalaharituber pfeilii]|nr:cyclin-like protein [Kalaharituber pfeilii]